MENLEELQNQFNNLTRELKELGSGSDYYAQIWNERAEISRKLNELRIRNGLTISEFKKLII